MKKIFAFVLLFAGLTACRAQQTINMVQGQTSSLTFIAKDNLGNVIPLNDYIAAPVIGDSTIVSYNGNSLPLQITALKTGTTTIQWTFTLKSGTPYTGGPITLQADTVNVSPLSIASAVVTYGTPQ